VTAPTTAGPDHPVEVDAGYPGAVPPDAGARIVDRVKRRLAAADTPVSGPAALRAAVATALQHEGLLLPPAQFAAAVRAVTEELTGLGPLAPLLADGRVTDICVNGPGEVWVERDGRLELTSIRFPRRPRSGRWCSGWSPRSGSGSTMPAPGSTPACPVVSASTPSCHPSRPTGRW
jgi:hypothetical protein